MMIRMNYIAVLLCFGFLLSSCSSSSTDILEETDPGGSGGGIGGSGITSFSVGTLTGFGSVFINGNRFDTTSAEFMINGQPAAQSQLRVGMQLTAEVDFNTAAADQVDYAAVLIGPITQAVDATGQLRVLNQPVVIGANTVLDSLVLTELVPDRAIEISGVTDANGNLIASYIRPATSSELQIAGTVRSVGDNQQRITVRNISVVVEQADLSPLNGMPIALNASVIVRAPANQFDVTTNTLIASSIAAATSVTPAENARLELTGFVQTFDGLTSFSVDGLQITTTGSTRYESVDGLPLEVTAVSLNSLIEVEGIFLSNGVIDAQRIVVLPVENSELTGRIESIDTSERSVTILGIPVRTTPLTRFSGEDNGTMNFESLRVGDYAEIDAAYTPPGLLATKIEIDDFDEEASLEGPVTRVDTAHRQIEIVGISIVFDDDTEFEIDQNDNEQEVNEQNFLNAVSVGTIVEAKWKVFSSILVPVDELEID
ncbi:MAG: hypothetical protein KTR32_03420 [Granulosicoccus sp.]|nr:hypothetical protein [Granulosicoccus sp.]